MQPFLLLSPGDSDAAALSASTEVSGALATALQNVQPARKWRSTTTTANLNLTFTSGIAANTLALVGHNLSANGTIRVRGGTSLANVTAAPSVDTGAVSAWPATGKPTVSKWPHFTSLVRWTAVGTPQYWRVDLADSTPATTYLEAGRLALGVAWQPSLNFDIGGTPLAFDTMDVQTRTPYGRMFTDPRNDSPARTFELQIYALTKREAFDGIYELQRLRGMWGDVICALDPTETTDFHRFTMQGAFTMGGAYTLPPAFDAGGSMFGAGIKLREFI